MSIHLKGIFVFFGILYFGLGCCLGNRANAEDPPLPLLHFYMYLAGVTNQYDADFDTREISGTVTESYEGKGLDGVEIYTFGFFGFPSVIFYNKWAEGRGYFS